jgi:transposase
MGRSRGGLTSKIHAVVDANGLPVRLALTSGEAYDNRLAGKLLTRLRLRPTRHVVAWMGRSVPSSV